VSPSLCGVGVRVVRCCVFQDDCSNGFGRSLTGIFWADCSSLRRSGVRMRRPQMKTPPRRTSAAFP